MWKRSLILFGLAMPLAARPAMAAGPLDGLLQGDAALFRAAISQPVGTSATVGSDSTRSHTGLLIAGGAAVAGLAAYFVTSATGNGPASPTSPPGIFTPPPNPPSFSSPPPTPPGPTPPVLNDPPADPVTVTPEPVTMALLASGLAGLSGMSMVRRRQR